MAWGHKSHAYTNYLAGNATLHVNCTKYDHMRHGHIMRTRGLMSYCQWCCVTGGASLVHQTLSMIAIEHCKARERQGYTVIW